MARMLKELEIWIVLLPKVNPDILSPFLPERAASFTLEPSIKEAIYTPAILTSPDLGLGSW